jgi:hypothetical protein
MTPTEYRSFEERMRCLMRATYEQGLAEGDPLCIALRDATGAS